MSGTLAGLSVPFAGSENETFSLTENREGNSEGRGQVGSYTMALFICFRLEAARLCKLPRTTTNCEYSNYTVLTTRTRVATLVQ